MNRYNPHFAKADGDFLYARGDEPTTSKPFRFAGKIFSTHVEMNRWYLSPLTCPSDFLYARGDEPWQNRIGFEVRVFSLRTWR